MSTRFLAEYIPASGTTFNQAVTATGVGTPLMTRRVGKNVTATGVGTPVFVRRVGKIMVVAATGTPVMVRRVGRILTVAATGTVSLLTLKLVSLVGSAWSGGWGSRTKPLDDKPVQRITPTLKVSPGSDDDEAIWLLMLMSEDV